MNEPEVERQWDEDLKELSEQAFASPLKALREVREVLQMGSKGGLSGLACRILLAKQEAAVKALD